MNRTYKDLIFTDHALERLRERDVTMSEAWATWRRANRSYYATTKGAWVFERHWGKRQIEVVATKNNRNQWVVISVWANQLKYLPQKPMWIRVVKWIVKRITN